jgi:hypothetical protein
MKVVRALVLLVGGAVAVLGLAPGSADGATWAARRGIGTFTSNNGTTPWSASWFCTASYPTTGCTASGARYRGSWRPGNSGVPSATYNNWYRTDYNPSRR